jgi:hypothetical protein
LYACLPHSFYNTEPQGFGRDLKMLAMAALAMNDLNQVTPRTGYSIKNVNDTLVPMLITGTTMWVMIFLQAEYTLVDVSYSENGFSINLDRVAKLGTSIERFEKMYKDQLYAFKNALVMSNGGVGLGSPRFQGGISRMVMALGSGSAFGWNIP